MTVISKSKVLDDWELYFSTDLAVEKIFCMCVCACIYARGHNLYPIVTMFGTQVGNVNSKVKFEDELCGSHREL